MKSYKEYPTHYIGESDIAALTITGIQANKGVQAEILRFGKDSAYSAYIADENAEIGAHYKLQMSFKNWIRIYDDYHFIVELRAEKINIYRAGEMGCIIQLIDEYDGGWIF
jgi:hypothetical protein